MSNALDVAGDVSSAGAALAGLLLVFMGSIAASFASISPDVRSVVVRPYQYRIWFAFIGLTLALCATLLALIGKWLQSDCLCIAALFFLIVSMGWAVAAAVRAALDVQ